MPQDIRTSHSNRTVCTLKIGGESEQACSQRQYCSRLKFLNILKTILV